MSILPAVARYMKLNFNSELKIRLKDTEDSEDSLELGDVSFGSPKRSNQELKEAAQRHIDSAGALAVEKRPYLDDNEEKVPLIYMHVLFVCVVDVGNGC